MSHFIIFDIETCPLELDKFSESQQEYLLRRAQTEEDKEKLQKEFALNPLTSKIVCLGLQLVEKNPGEDYNITKCAAFSLDESLSDGEVNEITLGDGHPCYLSSERTLLDTFWKILNKYSGSHLVSFNGRTFDAPYLMLRSAQQQLRPSRNLMNGTKFNYPGHTDLIDELCFYIPSQSGATRRYNFDFFTRAFGITSPKAEGVDGSKVADYFRDGKIAEISEYCLRDVRATWELYLYWEKYLKF
jgi:DNA polymerase elongation subunit (family B)